MPGFASVAVNGTSNSTSSTSQWDSSGAAGCKWGWPVLDPMPRSTDTWGIGWMNLHEMEVIEMMTADREEVCLCLLLCSFPYIWADLGLSMHHVFA